MQNSRHSDHIEMTSRHRMLFSNIENMIYVQVSCHNVHNEMKSFHVSSDDLQGVLFMQNSLHNYHTEAASWHYVFSDVLQKV